MNAIEDDHERCRKRVCAVCYRKGERSLSEREIKYIKEEIIHGYEMSNSNYPAEICDGCHLRICKALSDGITIPKLHNYDAQRPALLRNSLTCGCRICLIAKQDCINNLVLGKKKRGRPKMKEADDAESGVTLCTKCDGKIGAGIRHDCTRKYKVQNMLLTYTPTTSQRFASRVIDTNGGAPLATLGPNKKPVTPVPTKK